MRINWLSYYMDNDGYGRFSSRFVGALLRAGEVVVPLLEDHRSMPRWLLRYLNASWDDFTISCMPARAVKPLPGQGEHWLFSMCEGSALPKSWVRAVNKAGVSRVLVPCQHNAEVFATSGVAAPITVVPGGIDPLEFPLVQQRPERPYTFLALADRGARKGYMEVYDAFYKAFGGKTSGTPNVRLIIKNRAGSNRVLHHVSRSRSLDPRLTFIEEDVEEMASIYAQADCFVIPSYAEGWGMPHREAAAMGLCVITQRYSGMDDGYTHEWARVVEGGTFLPPAKGQKGGFGGWLQPNVDNLAAMMRDCYQRPAVAFADGLRAAHWLRQNQTWDHAAAVLLSLFGPPVPFVPPEVATKGDNGRQSEEQELLTLIKGEKEASNGFSLGGSAQDALPRPGRGVYADDLRFGAAHRL